MNTCKGLTGATWAGCAGSAMRNFIVAPDPIHDKNAIQKRIARLTWFKNYCDKLTDSDIQRRCMNYVGLTTAEVYTLDMPNSYTAPNAEKMCDGINVIQCYSALINSRWNRLGNSQAHVLPFCAAMINADDKKLCNKILSLQGSNTPPPISLAE